MTLATQNHVGGLRAVHSSIVNKQGPECFPFIMDATVLGGHTYQMMMDATSRGSNLVLQSNVEITISGGCSIMRAFRFAVLALAAAFAAHPASGQNLLINPDFDWDVQWWDAEQEVSLTWSPIIEVRLDGALPTPISCLTCLTTSQDPPLTSVLRLKRAE